MAFLQATEKLFEDIPSESPSAEVTASPALGDARTPAGYPTRPLPTECQPDAAAHSGLNRNYSTWDTTDPHTSPYDYPIISPVYRNNPNYAPQSMRSSQMTDQFGMWRSTSNAFIGNASARHATAQYLNMSGVTSSINASPNMQDPPGFPAIESESVLMDDTKRDGYDTPNLKGSLLGYDHPTIPFWAVPGGMMGDHSGHIQDWSDSIVHTPWSQRAQYQPFYSGPSPIAGGSHMFQSPFMRNEPVMYPPSSVTTVDRQHYEAPIEDIPACPSPGGTEGSEPQNFSPWKNLNNLPDCRPVQKNDSSDVPLHDGSNFRMDGSDGLEYPNTPSPHGGDGMHQRLAGRSSPSKMTEGVSKSLGSLSHPHDCRPCAFYWTKGCINGQDCRFCHEWHPPKKKKPMKEQKNLMIIARPDGKIEFMRCTVSEAMRVL